MIQKAVIDRLEGNYAVITIGDGDGRLEVLRDILPDGCQEGTWLKIRFGDTSASLEIDQPNKNNTHSRIADKLARLVQNKQRK